MRNIAFALCLILSPVAGQAMPIDATVPGAKVRGEATFRFLGVPLYQARLLTKDGAPFDWQQNFGLELTYLRALSQSDLVQGTRREMSRIGAPPPSAKQLETCFNDVARGDTYLAASKGPNRLIFYRNGQRTCVINKAGITRSFMSIFLGKNTRSASFTRRLQGL